VGILGPLEVGVGGAAVEVGGVRLRALLIRLALDVGRLVTVDALAEALWGGDTAPADPANALQSLVSRLRRALPRPEALCSSPGGYRLDLPPDAVDALRFERLARDGQRALRAGDAVAAVRMLDETLRLWRGPALLDVRDAPYALAPAARLEELRLAAEEDRIEALLATGGHGDLVAELEQLTAAHPLRERRRGLLMRALYEAGRPAEALAAYEQFRRLIADELGVDPSPRLRDIHLTLLRGEPTPPPVSARGNPRVALTSFVGRDDELALVDRQLKDSRLVTLVGPGGAGKTRLATVAAQRAGERLSGGVWLVELAPLTDPAQVAQAVLGVLEVREGSLLESTPPASPRDATGRLVATLSGAELLLVLDNCEHLVEAAARLAEELLSRCPGLRVLATSREPLGILGEALCDVPPLRLPAPEASVLDALACPAVQLLRDRAAAVRPGFAVDARTVGAVVEICRRLDGLPLAIELAAARLRSLSAEQVAARLDDRFRLLTGGSRTALPRHRTLRAVVAWSWELLDDAERVLAARLAVFPAGVTPESAAGVCADARVPASAMLDLLGALVDRSLLQVVDDAQPRYRMLETIREYGLERLAEAGEVAGIRAAHAAHFLALAETADPHLRGPDQLTWIRRLTAERDNLHAALRFACDTGDADTAVRLGAALGSYWTIHGIRAETAGWLRLALDLPGEAPPGARAIASAVYVLNCAVSGELDQCKDLLRRMTELAGAVDPAAGHPVLALIEPTMAMFTDDAAQGLAEIDRRLGHPDPWTRAMLRLLRAFILENDGDAVGMRADLLAAASAFRELGDRWALSIALTPLAEAQAMEGDTAAAIAALEESIRLMRELNPDDDVGHQRVRLAALRAECGDVARAHADLTELLELGDRPGSTRNVAFALVILGELARYAGDLDEAQQRYEAAAAKLAFAPLAPPQIRAMIDSAMSYLAQARGDLPAAARYAAAALEAAMEARDMPVVAKVGVGAARVHLLRGDPLRAARALGATEALRGMPDRSNRDSESLAESLWCALGDAAFGAAFAEGRAADRSAALALLDPGR